MTKLFEKNSRVCFLGDSITAGGLFVAHIFQYYNDNLHERNVRIFNCGVSGDTSNGAWDRLQDDVARFSPNEMVIMFGMNDMSRWLYGVENPTIEYVTKRKNYIDWYVNNIIGLTKHYLSLGYPVTVCSTPCYDEYSNVAEKNLFGLNEGMLIATERIKKGLAELPIKAFIDIFSNLKDLYVATRANNRYVRPDRVHPTEYGHYFMAQVFLNGQGLDVDIPTVSQMESLTASDVALTPANNKRFQAEQKLRHLGFVEWNNVPFDKAGKTDQEKADYWKEHAKDLINSPWGTYPYEMATFYAQHKPYEKQYLAELLQITDDFVDKKL